MLASWELLAALPSALVYGGGHRGAATQLAHQKANPPLTSKTRRRKRKRRCCLWLGGPLDTATPQPSHLLAVKIWGV